MREIIEKTLPADPTERAALEEAEAFMRAQDAKLQDAAMLKRDEPKAKPAPAAEDQLAGVRNAASGKSDNGLLTSHNPDRRLL